MVAAASASEAVEELPILSSFIPSAALPCVAFRFFVLDFGWMGGNTRTRLYNLDDFLFLFVCMCRPPFDDGSDGRGRSVRGEADGSSHVNDSTHCTWYLVSSARMIQFAHRFSLG